MTIESNNVSGLDEVFRTVAGLDLLNGKKVLYESLHGSRLYGTAKTGDDGSIDPLTDYDIKIIYADDIRNVLGMYFSNPAKSINDKIRGPMVIDCESHEIAKFCQMLSVSNVNFIEYILSPFFVSDSSFSSFGDGLRNLARECVSKRTFSGYVGIFHKFLDTVTKFKCKDNAKSILNAFRYGLAGLNLADTGEISFDTADLFGKYGFSNVYNEVLKARANDPNWDFDLARGKIKNLEGDLVSAAKRCEIQMEVGEETVSKINELLVTFRLKQAVENYDIFVKCFNALDSPDQNREK